MRFIVFSVKGMVSMGNKILLLKRSLDRKYCRRCWEFVGGKVETFNIKKDFIREAKEETGLKVEKVRYRGILFKRSVLYKTIFGWPAWHCIIFVAASCTSQNVKISREHMDFKWFSLWQTKTLILTPETKYALKKYVK